MTNYDKSNIKFDSGEFNIAFDKYIQQTKKNTSIKSEERLGDLLYKERIHNTYFNNPIFDIFVEIKNTWFYILDDIIQFNIGIDIFTKGNRLFNLGMTFLFIAIILIITTFIIDDDIGTNNFSNSNSNSNYVDSNFYSDNKI